MGFYIHIRPLSDIRYLAQHHVQFDVRSVPSFFVLNKNSIDMELNCKSYHIILLQTGRVKRRCIFSELHHLIRYSLNYEPPRKLYMGKNVIKHILYRWSLI